ncbi:hypothetical protein BGZ74_004103 [Mortierella antarctica]|nr:hypothetical protein BGZ74_004103 [Mortierella antarctica]
MDIDQASVAGNIRVLDHMRILLNKSKFSFKSLKMIIAGDHLTVSRIQTIQEQSIDMAVYIEFCAAIKAGDVGRIEQVLKRITIMFQAGKHINYGLELLRLSYNIRYKWGTNRKNAIFSSMLMNTQGRKNHFIPSDLYQEHNNLLTKQTHAIVGNKWSAMSYITPNIRLFQGVASKLDKEFSLPKNSTSHKTTTMDSDIEHVMRSLDDHGILGEDLHPVKHQEHPYTMTPAIDLMTEGIIKLVHGGYNKFIQCMEEEKLEEQLAMDRNLDELMKELDEETNRASKYLDETFK